MITLQAPYDVPLFSVEICNPELGDNLILDTRVSWIKAYSGLTYGYKKTDALKKLTLVFKSLTRRKGLEILQFLQNSSLYNTRYIDKDGNVWSGIITNYPVELITTGPGAGQNGERAEDNQITIEFEGILKLSGLFFEDFTPVYNEDSDLVLAED